MDEVGKRIETTIRDKLVKSFYVGHVLERDMVEKVTGLFKSELKDFLAETSRDCRKT